MQILGIDYGQKRVGISVADTKVPVAVPRGVFSAENALSDIAALCRKEHIERIVLGLPLTLSGEERIMAQEVRAFGERLRQETGNVVEYIDERFSSKMGDTDAGAATLILQTWLERYLAQAPESRGIGK